MAMIHILKWVELEEVAPPVSTYNLKISNQEEYEKNIHVIKPPKMILLTGPANINDIIIKVPEAFVAIHNSLIHVHKDWGFVHNGCVNYIYGNIGIYCSHGDLPFQVVPVLLLGYMPKIYYNTRRIGFHSDLVSSHYCPIRKVADSSFIFMLDLHRLDALSFIFTCDHMAIPMEFTSQLESIRHHGRITVPMGGCNICEERYAEK